MILSRRRTLQLLVAAIATGAMPGAAGASLCRQWTDGLDMNAAGALGREYLDRYPLDPALKEVLALLRTPADAAQTRSAPAARDDPRRLRRRPDSQPVRLVRLADRRLHLRAHRDVREVVKESG